MESGLKFQRLDGLTIAVTVFLALKGISLILFPIVNVFVIRSLSGAIPVMYLGMLLAVPVQVLNFTTLVIFSVWIYRAAKNVCYFGAENLTFSPIWSVAGLYIPLVNLFIPFVALQQIWKAGINPAEWAKEKPSVAVIIVWITFVISYFIFLFFTFIIHAMPYIMEQYAVERSAVAFVFTMKSMISAAIILILIFALIYTIHKISVTQSDRAAKYQRVG